MSQNQVQVQSKTAAIIHRIGPQARPTHPTAVDPTLVRARAERLLHWQVLRAADKIPAQRQESVAHRRRAMAYNEAETALAILEGRKAVFVFASDWRRRNEAETAERGKRW